MDKHSSWQRHIPLQGARNFRDFGGYPSALGGFVKRGVLGGFVKRGVLFRAGILAQLTDADQAVVETLGVSTICDLRRERESGHHPTRWPDDERVRFLSLPLFVDGGSGEVMGRAAELNSPDASHRIMEDLYRQMVIDAHARAQTEALLRVLGSGQLPLVLHCSGGKDRTGLVCAVILTLLGVDHEEVMADYMLSRDYFTSAIDKSLQSRAQMLDTSRTGGQVAAEVLLPVYDVREAYLQAAFAAMEEHFGGFAGFVSGGLGLSEDDVAAIRSALLQ